MDSKKLMMDIVKCGLSCADAKSPCHCIWEAQECRDVRDFHLPEPWNGDIENAPVIVMSINPRITPGELFPRMGYPFWLNENGQLREDRVADFFANRFAGFYVTNDNGTRFQVRYENKDGDEKGALQNPRGRYWSQVHQAVRLMLNKETVVPGVDYVLTEVAHCKTLEQSDVPRPCREACVNKWFDKVIKVAKNARMILVLGAVARGVVAKHLNVCGQTKYVRYDLSEKGLSCIFVDHPAAHGPGIDMRRLGVAMGNVCSVNNVMPLRGLGSIRCKRVPRYPAL